MVIRKKEVYDGATPSGNAVMAHSLFYLSIIFDNSAWREHAESMLQSLGQAIGRYPTSFGVWALFLQSLVKNINEIAITGKNAHSILKDVMKEFIPNKIVQASPNENEKFPLLKNKKSRKGETLIYLCSNYSCREPVKSVSELMSLLETK